MLMFDVNIVFGVEFAFELLAAIYVANMPASE
jgi:hypothetical protein